MSNYGFVPIFIGQAIRRILFSDNVGTIPYSILTPDEPIEHFSSLYEDEHIYNVTMDGNIYLMSNKTCEIFKVFFKNGTVYDLYPDNAPWHHELEARLKASQSRYKRSKRNVQHLFKAVKSGALVI